MNIANVLSINVPECLQSKIASVNSCRTWAGGWQSGSKCECPILFSAMRHRGHLHQNRISLLCSPCRRPGRPLRARQSLSHTPPVSGTLQSKSFVASARAYPKRANPNPDRRTGSGQALCRVLPMRVHLKFQFNLYSTVTPFRKFCVHCFSHKARVPSAHCFQCCQRALVFRSAA